MADLLAAASLMLALLAMLYGVWYDTIAKAIAVKDKMPSFYEDAGRQRDQVTEALRRRARPLAWATAGLVLILLPNVVGILASSAKGAWHEKLGAASRYDAVSAALVFVVVMAVFFGFHLFSMVRQLKEISDGLRGLPRARTARN